MEKEPWEIDKSLENVVGSPYVFKLKDGLKLSLDEWTIDAEKWAKEHFGTTKKLFNTLMRIDCDDDECIDATMLITEFKLTADSRRIVDERRGELTTLNFLIKNIIHA